MDLCNPFHCSDRIKPPKKKSFRHLLKRNKRKRRRTKNREEVAEGVARVEDSVEAIPVPVVRHVDQPFTASQPCSVTTGGQPEAGAADTASATYAVSLLESKLTKSSNPKRIKCNPHKPRGKIPSKSH